jgi:hypothetical protein
MYPSVLRLKVHLEGQQRITYPANANLAEVVRDAKDTHLTAWMKHNATAAATAAILGPHENDFRNVLYMDFCGSCRWDDKRRVWVKRVLRSTQIGRMYFVNPREGERYYLRLLLCHVPGATTYNDLRTLDGELHPTFKVRLRIEINIPQKNTIFTLLIPNTHPIHLKIMRTPNPKYHIYILHYTMLYMHVIHQINILH